METGQQAGRRFNKPSWARDKDGINWQAIKAMAMDFLHVARLTG